MLAGLFGVMLGMHMMAMRDMRVVTGFVMIPRLVMIGSRAMMLRGMFMMLGSFAMVLGSLVRHS